MITFNATGYFQIIQIMAGWSVTRADDKTIVNEENRVENAKNLRDHSKVLSRMGFSASIVTMEKMAKRLDQADCKWHDIASLAKEFLDRIIDESKTLSFFSLTVRESMIYSSPREGWQSSIARFPNIVDDVVEVSRCFSLSRYSAAVFHSVQIVEAGLIELGTFLKVSDPRSGWTAVSNALDKIIRKSHKDRTRFEKANFDFLEQMQGTVLALKNAWRNKISHVHGRLVVMSTEFSPEVAEEIMYATRAFIRRLAEGIPPPKAKKGKASEASIG